MKKIIALILTLSLTATLASAWGRLGHATVACIAQENLTPKAQKALNEYLHGYSLVAVASLNDNFKKLMTVDMGYDFNDAPRVNSLPHTFEADLSFEPNRQINDNGRYVKNCLWFIEKYAQDLKNAKNMDDSTRFAEIASIVHFVGDMHCPMHIRYYPVDMEIGHQNVVWQGQKIRFHTIWDDGIIVATLNWSYSDIAAIVDRFDKKVVKQWTEGDVWDWGHDSAESSWPIHQVKEGDKLDRYYARRNQAFMETQLAKAGHRLAKLLNEIFK